MSPTYFGRGIGNSFITTPISGLSTIKVLQVANRNLQLHEMGTLCPGHDLASVRLWANGIKFAVQNQGFTTLSEATSVVRMMLTSVNLHRAQLVWTNNNPHDLTNKVQQSQITIFIAAKLIGRQYQTSQGFYYDCKLIWELKLLLGSCCH